MNRDDVVELAAPADYWRVTADELDRIARGTLAHWDDAPPDWVSDGVEFYSLRDAIGLLATALANGMPAELPLRRFYGPLEGLPGAGTAVPRGDILDLADQVATAAAVSDEPWTPVPTILPSGFATTFGTINTAQALYVLAAAYAATADGQTVHGVVVPASDPAPGTADILADLTALAPIDSAWSLKPARIRPE